MAVVTLNDVLARQGQMAELIAQLERTTDPDKVRRLTSEITIAGRELEAVAREFEVEVLRTAGPPPAGFFEVALTSQQRARILATTGIALESVRVNDTAGTMTRAMPHTAPEQIEALALAEAERIAIERSVAGKTRAEVEALLSSIENSGGGALKRHVEQLRADPTFLGGVLHRK